jgi:hypothetical protein
MYCLFAVLTSYKCCEWFVNVLVLTVCFTLLCRWFGKLLLEGTVFAGSSHAVGSNCARELRGALNKNKLKDGSAAVVTQMKPIPKVALLFELL